MEWISVNDRLPETEKEYFGEFAKQKHLFAEYGLE